MVRTHTETTFRVIGLVVLFSFHRHVNGPTRNDTVHIESIIKWQILSITYAFYSSRDLKYS